MVADELRERILSSDLPDGSLLPKQEDLLEEFRVSMPSIREALRILETEGLITVLRGNTGGAAIRLPQVSKVAYMLALVLQSRAVGVGDVADALRDLEALCAARAAERDDRARTVVPVLAARIAASEAAIDDADEYVHQARLFHEELVAGCGNETFMLMVGALESLWSSHVDRLARRTARLGEFAEVAVRKKMLDDHVRLVNAIRRGDARKAEQLMRAHYAQPERHEFVAAGNRISASMLRDD